MSYDSKRLVFHALNYRLIENQAQSFSFSISVIFLSWNIHACSNYKFNILIKALSKRKTYNFAISTIQRNSLFYQSRYFPIYFRSIHWFHFYRLKRYHWCTRRHLWISGKFHWTVSYRKFWRFLGWEPFHIGLIQKTFVRRPHDLNSDGHS